MECSRPSRFAAARRATARAVLARSSCAALLCLASATAAAQEAVLFQPENVRTEYGQVLRAEPIYETQTETWLERQCEDGNNKLLSRIADAVKDAFKPGKSDQSGCRDVPVERRFRRLAAYQVDYIYKGTKYRSRLPYDPGNRIKLRVSVAPYATYPGR